MPSFAGAVRLAARARCVRRGLRRAHQGQEEPRHRRAGPHGAQEPHAPRRSRLGSEALRRRGLSDPDSRQVLPRRNGQAQREAAAGRPIWRGHGVPAARSRLAPRLRVRNRARDQGRGQVLLGWRDVPVDNSDLAEPAKRIEPVIRQVFIGRGKGITVTDALERKLYIIRKSAGHAIQALKLAHGKEFYVPTMSARTVCYKGMLLRLPGRGVLPRSEGHARRIGACPRASALLDQHLPQLGPRASIPHDLPQRRDQYAARQHQLDPRAPGRDLLAHARPGSGQGVAADLRRTVGFGLVRQCAGAAGDGRLLGRPRHDDDDSGGVGKPHPDGSRAPRILRIPRGDDGAVGRPGLDRLHRWTADRRDARPQRAASLPLHRHFG